MLNVTPDVVTVLNAPLTTPANGYNSKVRDWTNAVRTETVCRVQPVTTAETLESSGSRDQVITRYRVWFPAGTAVTATSRILWGTWTLAVDGDPQIWNDFFGNPDHVEVLAVISKG